MWTARCQRAYISWYYSVPQLMLRIVAAMQVGQPKALSQLGIK